MLQKDREKELVRDKEQQLDARQRQPQGRQQGRFFSPLAQMDRLFDEVFRRPFLSAYMSQRENELEEQPYLPVDIFEDNESVIVKAELPGIKKENIDIQLSADSITISGEKQSEERVEQKDYFRLERSYGSFTRRFQLPVETQSDKARASFKDGILEVRIPKSQTSTPQSRKVTIE